jgi:hypothetical protein
MIACISDLPACPLTSCVLPAKRTVHLDCTVYRAGHALSRSWGKLFPLALSRSFFGPKFRAFVFALLDFSRSSIFRAFYRAPRFFAYVRWRFLIFVLEISCSCVYIYTARTGQPGQYTLNRTGRTGRTDIIGQAKQDRLNKTGRIG